MNTEALGLEVPSEGASFNEVIAQYEADISQLKYEMAAAASKHSTEIMVLNRQYTKEVESLEQEHAAEIASWDEQHTAQVAALMKQNQQLVAQKDRAKQAYEDMYYERDADVAELEDAMAELKKQFDQLVVEKKRYKRDSQDAVEEHVEDIAEILEERTATMDVLLKQNEQPIAGRELLEQQVEAMEAEILGQGARLITKFAAL